MGIAGIPVFDEFVILIDQVPRFDLYSHSHGVGSFLQANGTGLVCVGRVT